MPWQLGDVARWRGWTWRPPACLRKQRHETFDDAEAHRLDVLQNKGTDGAPLEIYWCGYCDAWHVGRALGHRRKDTCG